MHVEYVKIGKKKLKKIEMGWYHMKLIIVCILSRKSVEMITFTVHILFFSEAPLCTWVTLSPVSFFLTYSSYRKKLFVTGGHMGSVQAGSGLHVGFTKRCR